jgi:hypothetical protein
MDILDKFLRKISYKFPKGYPDINDAQDMLMLETLLEKLGVPLEENRQINSATKQAIAYFLSKADPSLGFKTQHQILFLLYLHFLEVKDCFLNMLYSRKYPLPVSIHFRS